jgi:PEP-CTERM motif
MIRKRLLQTGFPIVAALLWLGLSGAARADVFYHVSVNTSSISGTSGYVGFQFTPASPPPPPTGSQAATAFVTNFAPLGALTGVESNTGVGVSGALAANTLSIMNVTNSPVPQDDAGINYGNSFSFDLRLSGPAINMPDPTDPFGTTFSLFVYDSGFNPELTTNPAGSVLDINILPFGAGTSVTTYPSGQGQPPAATVTQTNGGIPEPSSLLLLGLGLTAAAAYGRRTIYRFAKR